MQTSQGNFAGAPRTAVATSHGTLRARPSTAAFFSSAGAAVPETFYHIKDGHFTHSIYSLIQQNKFKDAIKLLRQAVGDNGDVSDTISDIKASRSTCSLLAYCFYQISDFQSASQWYERLTLLCPSVDTYKLYLAETLFKSGRCEEAEDVCMRIEDPQVLVQKQKLLAAIKFQMGDPVSSKMLVETGSPDDPDTHINLACLLFKEGKWDEAMRKWLEAQKMCGYKAEIGYCVALCHYMQRRYVASLKTLSEVIERGIKEHPEFLVGLPRFEDDEDQNQSLDAIKFIGNSQALHESKLIEAFNLKAAIEYQLKNYDGAREALLDMPSRQETDLDPVTLHNYAIFRLDKDPQAAFEKMTFLLGTNPCPPETFGNLLILYIKYNQLDSAADFMAEYAAVAQQLVDPFLRKLMEAMLVRRTLPEEAFQQYDDMSVGLVDNLRNLTKQVQQGRNANDDDAVKRAIVDFDEAIEHYIPIVMAQASIFWDFANWTEVERVLKKSMEYCNEHDVWRLNVGHVLFMQEKYLDATSFYEPYVQKYQANILQVPAIVLANLCVAYIMTSRNDVAEELMRRVEREEESQIKSHASKSKKQYLHFCVVNLVIGTLYCSKGNYEFGISRIIKSISPIPKKLSTDTWFYAKRCILALFEVMTKHMILLSDGVQADLFSFLDGCQKYGKKIPAYFGKIHVSENRALVGKDGAAVKAKAAELYRNSVAYEARCIKYWFLKLDAF